MSYGILIYIKKETRLFWKRTWAVNTVRSARSGQPGPVNQVLSTRSCQPGPFNQVQSTRFKRVPEWGRVGQFSYILGCAR